MILTHSSADSHRQTVFAMNEAQLEKSLREAKEAREKAEDALAASKALEARLSDMLATWRLAQKDNPARSSRSE